MSMLFKRIKDWATSITAFRTGDVMPVDGPSGTAKMPKDDLLRETAQNALAGNVAPAFDPDKPNGDDGYAYHVDDKVVYEGLYYRFKRNKTFGAWDSTKVERVDVSKVLADEKVFENFALGFVVPKMRNENWLKASNTTDGYFLFYNTGTPSVQNTFCYTEKTPIIPNTNYYCKKLGGGSQVCFYDFEGNYVSGILIDSNDKLITTPANVYFAVFSFTIATKGTAYVSKDSDYGRFTDYDFDGYYVNDNKVQDYESVKQIFYNLISPVVGGHNWLDTSSIKEGYYLNYLTGKESAVSSFCYTENYIPIAASISYEVHSMDGGGSQLCLYDRSKKFIGGFLVDQVTTFTTPSNACFARYSFPKGKKDNAFVTIASDTAPKDAYAFLGYYVDSRKIVYYPQDTTQKEIIVAKDGSGDYATLTDAAAAASSGDIIRVRAGVYDGEEVELWGKTVTIIGDGCYNTIIKNGLNTYERPPIEMSSGVLRDIQFYSYGEGTPSGQTGWSSYAMHCESNDMANNSLDVENCIFRTAKGVGGIGMGMRGGCSVIFRNCQFIAEHNVAFYVHDAAGSSYVGVQDIRFENCSFDAVGDYAIRLVSEKKEGTTVNCTFLGNVFANDGDTPRVYKTTEGSGTATGNTNMDLINWNKTKLCFGNNIDSLNYQ